MYGQYHRRRACCGMKHCRVEALGYKGWGGPDCANGQMDRTRGLMNGPLDRRDERPRQNMVEASVTCACSVLSAMAFSRSSFILRAIASRCCCCCCDGDDDDENEGEDNEDDEEDDD